MFKNLFGKKQNPEERRREGIRLAELGAGDYNQSKLRDAITHYEQGLVILNEVGDKRTACGVLGNLGAAYADLGNTGKAMECHEKALEIARQVGHKRVEGNALRNLGLAYTKLGEYTKALEYHRQEAVVANELQDTEAAGAAVFNRSLLLDKLDRRTEAISNAEAALKIYQLTNSPYAHSVQSQLNRWRESAASSPRKLLEVFIYTVGRALSEAECNKILDNDPDTKNATKHRVRAASAATLPDLPPV